MASYAYSTLIDADYDSAIGLVTEALATYGFGVLTKVDVQATLKAKLGADTEPYMILGACNPPFAHQALETDPDIGLLLPCNVVVRSTEEGTMVTAVDPHMMVTLAGSEMEALADEVGNRLEAALASLPGAQVTKGDH